MGRHAQGWKLKQRKDSDFQYVWFWHEGRRYYESTGERDLGAAKTQAARIYAEVVSGRREKLKAQRRRPAVTLPLDVLLAKWIGSLETELSRETVKNYEMYAQAHYIPFFASLDRITNASCADYVRTRLRGVQRKTVLKELSALRRFLAWCVEQGHLLESELPLVKAPPRKAVGTASPNRKVGGWIGLTAEEAHAIIAKLPEKARGNRPARAYYQSLWETGLRPQTLCSLRAPEDYRRGAETLKIRDEADKSRWGREVPLSKAAREAFDAVCPDAGYLFPRKSTGGPACYRMTLRRAAREAGLAKDRAARISDYDFRHGRTTHLVEKSGDILGAGYLVGHKHATTTNTYLHARSNMAKNVLAMVAGDGSEEPHAVQLVELEDARAEAAAFVDSLPQLSTEPSAPKPAQYRRTQRASGSASLSASAQPTDITPVRGTGLEPAHLAVPEPKSGASAIPPSSRERLRLRVVARPRVCRARTALSRLVQRPGPSWWPAARGLRAARWRLSFAPDAAVVSPAYVHEAARRDGRRDVLRALLRSGSAVLERDQRQETGRGTAAGRRASWRAELANESLSARATPGGPSLPCPCATTKLVDRRPQPRGVTQSC